MNNICYGFLKILNILDLGIIFQKNRFFEILGIKNQKFWKTEIAIL